VIKVPITHRHVLNKKLLKIYNDNNEFNATKFTDLLWFRQIIELIQFTEFIVKVMKEIHKICLKSQR